MKDKCGCRGDAAAAGVSNERWEAGGWRWGKDAWAN